jgi:hypothetical protein
MEYTNLCWAAWSSVFTQNIRPSSFASPTESMDRTQIKAESRLDPLIPHGVPHTSPRHCPHVSMAWPGPAPPVKPAHLTRRLRFCGSRNFSSCLPFQVSGFVRVRDLRRPHPASMAVSIDLYPLLASNFLSICLFCF